MIEREVQTDVPDLPTWGSGDVDLLADAFHRDAPGHAIAAGHSSSSGWGVQAGQRGG